MSDPVYQKTEWVGTSSTSFQDAVDNAVAKASAEQANTSWFEVVEPRGSIVDGKIKQYQVTIRVGSRLA
jgi:dodecin